MPYELLFYQDYLTLENSIEYANQAYWNLAIVKGKNGWWYVKGGEMVILKADSRETVEAFVYGMGMAYSVLPNRLIEQYRDEMDIF